MKIAFSPCPNDTFLFHGWVSGAIKGPQVDATLADIQELNELARGGEFDLIKVSCAALPALLSDYAVLPIGAAIGDGCGPLLVSCASFPLAELSKKRVAIPGKDTTAHTLLSRVAPPPAEKVFCLYHEVDALLEAGAVDAGVIIHEMRFTHGRCEIADLGKLWEARYQVAVPLGCLVVRRSVARDVVGTLEKSLAHAYKNEPMAYMQKHAQELEEAVIRKHIALYVTEETRNLTSGGIAAISHLIQKSPEEFLYEADRLCPSP